MMAKAKYKLMYLGLSGLPEFVDLPKAQSDVEAEEMAGDFTIRNRDKFRSLNAQEVTLIKVIRSFGVPASGSD